MARSNAMRNLLNWLASQRLNKLLHLARSTTPEKSNITGFTFTLEKIQIFVRAEAVFPGPNNLKTLNEYGKILEDGL